MAILTAPAFQEIFCGVRNMETLQMLEKLPRLHAAVAEEETDRLMHLIPDGRAESLTLLIH